MKKMLDGIQGIKTGYYEIDSKGNIYSYKSKKFLKKRIVCSRNRKKEYRQETVCLQTVDGKAKNFRIHRLLLMAFNPIEGMDNFVVNHKNGNSMDNRLENLEWCTIAENNKHAFDIGLNHKGSKHARAKLSEEDIVEIIKEINNGTPTAVIGEKFGVKRTTIKGIEQKRSWKDIVDTLEIRNRSITNSVYSLNEIEQIKDLLQKNPSLKNKEIALKVFGYYHTKFSTLIWKIKHNKGYKNF